MDFQKSKTMCVSESKKTTCVPIDFKEAKETKESRIGE